MRTQVKLGEAKKIKAREKIVSTAKKIFFRKGYANTTIDEIAEKAGVGKGSIYLHFKNKDDLFVSLMIPTLNRLGEKLADFEKNLSEYRNNGEIIKHYFDINWDLYKFDPDGHKIIQAYQQGDLFLTLPSKTVEKFNKPAKRNYEISRRIIVRAQRMGILAKVDPFPLADILWATFLGIASLEESKRRVNKKDHVLPTAELAFSLLAKGLVVGKEKNL